MAKFTSVLVKKEVKNIDGSIKVQGQVVWKPINEAAKAHRVVEKAVQLGVYNPKDPNEMKNTKQKLKEKELADLKRRGLIPRNANITSK